MHKFSIPAKGVIVENTWTHIPPINAVQAGLPSFTTLNEDLYPLPDDLEAGVHIFDVASKAVGSIRDAQRSRVVLRVLDEQVLSEEEDSDGDGISDAKEGVKDEDGDLIPDYLDGVSQCELQILDNNLFNQDATYGGFVLQSEAGTCVKLGHLSQYHNVYGPMVDADSADTNMIAPDAAHPTHYSESNLVNFTVTDIANDTVTVIVPLKEPIMLGAVYRKYTDRSGWQDF